MALVADSLAVRRLHRAMDGFVTIHKKIGKEWRNLPAIRTAELEKQFASLPLNPEESAYFSIC